MNEVQSNNILIDVNVIKQIVADIVRKTPGISEVQGFLVKNINKDNNIERIITIEQLEDEIMKINFSIAVQYGHLILEIPIGIQNKIHKMLKENLNLDTEINITVTNVVNYIEKD